MSQETVKCKVARRDLLQAFRAMQAVSEAGFSIALPPHEIERWQYSSNWFDFHFAAAGEAPKLPIDINHRLPLVTIGSIQRPLLFPHAVFVLYRSSWRGRDIRFCFEGKKTQRRKRTLSEWEHRNSARLGLGRRQGDPSLYGRWSDKGREWPTKAWQPDYVARLGRSQFALCPDGDFVWTYRFFEAVAAGSIPVIESMSELYEGFRIYRMTDPIDSLVWRASEAKANYERARGMLTVPVDELASEVRRLVGR